MNTAFLAQAALVLSLVTAIECFYVIRMMRVVTRVRFLPRTWTATRVQRSKTVVTVSGLVHFQPLAGDYTLTRVWFRASNSRSLIWWLTGRIPVDDATRFNVPFEGSGQQRIEATTLANPGERLRCEVWVECADGSKGYMQRVLSVQAAGTVAWPYTTLGQGQRSSGRYA